MTIDYFAPGGGRDQLNAAFAGTGPAPSWYTYEPFEFEGTPIGDRLPDQPTPSRRRVPNRRMLDGAVERGDRRARGAGRQVRPDET